ncbi:MAG: hypothetical protein ACI9T7_000399 [Oleiphilaceae bacterium]|jgi:hypothetical protein
MKKQEVKSFTFKAAQLQENSNEQLKVRDGVAIAGCSWVELPRGSGNYEPKMARWGSRSDNGYWC